jgi:hypothetical protein
LSEWGNAAMLHCNMHQSIALARRLASAFVAVHQF